MRLLLSNHDMLVSSKQLTTVLRMLELLEDCFGIPVFPEEVIGIEIMRRRKTEGDVSTFCVCGIQYSSREVLANKKRP